MHQEVVTAYRQHGALNGTHSAALNTISASLNGTPMEIDQVLQILMDLQKQGSRRDAQLEFIIDGNKRLESELQKLSKEKEDRLVITDGWHRETVQELKEVKDRLKKLEDNGLSAWTAKKVAQWSVLIGAAGVIFSAAWFVIKWLLAHVKI